MHDFVGSKPAAENHVKIPFVTKEGDFVESYVKVQKHTPEQDQRGAVAQRLAEAIVGFCSGCRTQATLEFVNGADHKDCDRAIQGKPVRAFCQRCRKVTEFLPAATYQNNPFVMRNQEYVREARGLKKEDFR